MKKHLLLSVSFLFLNTLLMPASAMENGFDAPKDGRTLALSNLQMGKVGTGFLYSERIVLTCGHCLFAGPNSNVFISDLRVSFPNIVYTAQSEKLKTVKKFLARDWEPRNEKNFSPRGDFGILILEKPIPVTGNTLIATKDEVEAMKANRTLITNVAYGRQSFEHGFNGETAPKYAEFPLVPDAELQEVVERNKRGNWITGDYHMNVNVLQKPGGPSTCSGDSGSPLYVRKGDDFIYLGPLANGMGGMPNCSGKPWESEVMYVGASAAYDYLDLIKEAEDYVKANPYVAPVIKKSIKCVKGKKFIKVRNENPTCPKGYKQK